MIRHARAAIEDQLMARRLPEKLAAARRRIRKVARRALGRPFDPKAYWSERHTRLRSSLTAVGNLGLGEAENRADYEAGKREVAAILRGLVPDPEGRHLLDAGCGIGAWCDLFSELGFEVVGVDFAPTAIERARRTATGTFVVADLDTMTLERKFHVVVCTSVLMHVVDETRARSILANLAAHLETDGFLVIHEGLREAEPRAPRPAEHVRLRTRSDYERLLADAGLRLAIEERYRLPHEPGEQTFLVSRLQPE